jgi:hypothetical protein
VPVPLLYDIVREGAHYHKNGRCLRSGHVIEIFHNREITNKHDHLSPSIKGSK